MPLTLVLAMSLSYAYACFTSGSATCSTGNQNGTVSCPGHADQTVTFTPVSGATGTKPYATANQASGGGGTSDDGRCSWDCQATNPCTGATVSGSCYNSSDKGTKPNTVKCPA